MLGAKGPTRRLLARGIDEGLVVAIQVAFVVPAEVLRQVTEESDGEHEAITVAGLCLLVTGWFVGVCYEVASNHLGGSPGKRVLGLRVVSADRCTVLPVGTSIRRWALVNGPQPLVWCAVGVVLADSTAVRLVCAALVAVSLLWRGSLAVGAWRGDGTIAVHDRLVGSKVVPARADEVSAAVSPTTPSPTPAAPGPPPAADVTPG